MPELNQESYVVGFVAKVADTPIYPLVKGDVVPALDGSLSNGEEIHLPRMQSNIPSLLLNNVQSVVRQEQLNHIW